MKEIILLFKTHLDIGFTNFSQTVVNDYMTKYIPNAIRTAAETRERGERFIWTTGSWLIYEYLRGNPDDKLIIDAIEQGDICWHGLPFTSHTELMNVNLFKYGLSLSRKLDERFGKSTHAAKMTDVPGHTRAIIPYMAEAGIKFLHIGVNAACPPPEVPPIFRWQSPFGEELLMMYQANYGLFQELGDSGIAVCFAHTGDNNGPQGADEIIKIYDELRKDYPDAYIHAGTLDDIANVVMTLDNLPVVTSEIGDTWIHGAGTDPKKVSQYRALLRTCEDLPAIAQEIYHCILPVPEHTWGLDEKTHLGKGYVPGQGFLGEHDNFIRTDFEAVRGTDSYRKMEQSWEEQRQYVYNGIEFLRKNHPELADEVICDVSFAKPDVDELTIFNFVDYEVRFNKHGEIVELIKNEITLADENHKLGTIMYQAFCKADYDRYNDEYITNRYDWAIEDLGKIGCDAAIKERLTVKPTLESVKLVGKEIFCELKFDGDAVELYGAPKSFIVRWTFDEYKISVDLCWYEKNATRVAEAVWFGFKPFGDVRAVRKLSEWIDPSDVVVKGNRRLHATDCGVMFKDGVIIETLDTALVNIGEPDLLSFHLDLPKVDEGVYFNLYNNMWGTNFPMWYDEDARFRFIIHF